MCFPTKKRAAYLPGSDDEQASAQNKREKNGMIKNARLEASLVLFFVSIPIKLLHIRQA